MARYFHATRMENVKSIEKQGLIPVWDFVYLTDSLESALRWMGFRFQAMGDRVMAIVEVEVDPKTLGEGTDHSPMMQSIFGAGKSFISEKKIPKSKIVEVHYYELFQNPPKEQVNLTS